MNHFSEDVFLWSQDWLDKDETDLRPGPRLWFPSVDPTPTVVGGPGYPTRLGPGTLVSVFVLSEEKLRRKRNPDW